MNNRLRLELKLKILLILFNSIQFYSIYAISNRLAIMRIGKRRLACHAERMIQKIIRMKVSWKEMKQNFVVLNHRYFFIFSATNNFRLVHVLHLQNYWFAWHGNDCTRYGNVIQPKFITKYLHLQVFFVLRKKNNQITFLHVYHHAGMVAATFVYIKFLNGNYTRAQN